MIDDLDPTAPPGFEGLTQILNWVAWGVIAACLLGFLISAARLGIAYRNGEMEGAKGLVLALIGCVIVGAAAGIFNAVTG